MGKLYNIEEQRRVRELHKAIVDSMAGLSQLVERCQTLATALKDQAAQEKLQEEIAAVEQESQRKEQAESAEDGAEAEIGEDLLEDGEDLLEDGEGD